MRSLTAVVLCLFLSFSVLAREQQTRFTVRYSGGSVSGLKHNDFLDFFINADELRFTYLKKTVETIPTGAVVELSYGEDSRRRVAEAIGLGAVTMGLGAALAYTSAKKHYIGITWDDKNGNKGGLVLEAGSGDYRGLLVALEGLTGKKAVESDPPRDNVRPKKK